MRAVEVGGGLHWLGSAAELGGWNPGRNPGRNRARPLLPGVSGCTLEGVAANRSDRRVTLGRAACGLAGCVIGLSGCAGGAQTQGEISLPDVGRAFAAVGAMLGFSAAVGELDRAGGDPSGPGPYSSSSVLDRGNNGW